MKTFSLLSLTFILLFTAPVQASDTESTYIIKGSILDHSTHVSIENVNVFLSKTTYKTASDRQGNYQMERIIPGNYDMVFQADGYEQLVVNVDIHGSKTLEIDAFLLKKSSPELPVSDRDKTEEKEWKRSLEQFKTIFLGSGSNAENSEIINPEVLDFSINDQNQLSVSANGELQIMNHSLGYQLFVTIRDFTWDLKSDTGYFSNLIQMNELEPGSSAEYAEWASNRAKTYNQSLRKFLYTLSQDTPTPGFAYTYNTSDIPADNSESSIYGASASIFSSYAVKARGPQGGRFIKITDQDVIRQLYPQSDISNIHLFEIRSNYDNIAVLPDFRRGTGDAVWNSYISDWNSHKGNFPNPESERLSYLGHVGDSDAVRYLAVDNYGNLLNPLEVRISGYWARDRIADFLPFNFQPVQRDLAAM